MTESEKRSAQLVMVTGFVALFLIFHWKPFLYIGVGVGAGSLISSYIGNLFVTAWFKIAHVLGWINTRIILTLVFYLFLFPLAILSRLGKKDIMKIKKRDRQTLYVQRDHLYTKKDLENSW